MEMATLGKTGLRVSRLGAGLVGIGGHPSMDDVSMPGRLLNAALDAGINFLDTAECYGVSEELIGKTIAHRRHEYVLATKAGHLTMGHSGTPWTGETVSRGIELSLQRLSTDYLDLVQVHAYDISAPTPDDVLQALLDAKRAGKTRFLGYSGENEDARWALDTGHFDTLQTAFSVADQRARYGLFEMAEERGVGIIGKRPIANAMWGREERPPGSGTSAKLWERSKAMAGMGPIPGAPKDGIELALGFVLGHPEVDTAIVGTTSPEHMLSNIDIVENRLPMKEGVLAELRRRFDEVGADWESID